MTIEMSIHQCIQDGDAKMVLAIVKENRDAVNDEHEFNGSPLHTAAKYGKDTIALILIAASADIDAVDKCKNTALHVATRFDHPKMVASLIGAGADVNVQNEDGMTPLHLAAEHSGPRSIATLIEAGANVAVKDKAGRTCMGAATSKENKAAFVDAQNSCSSRMNSPGRPPRSPTKSKGPSAVSKHTEFCMGIQDSTCTIS